MISDDVDKVLILPRGGNHFQVCGVQFRLKSILDLSLQGD